MMIPRMRFVAENLLLQYRYGDEWTEYGADAYGVRNDRWTSPPLRIGFSTLGCPEWTRADRGRTTDDLPSVARRDSHAEHAGARDCPPELRTSEPSSNGLALIGEADHRT